MFPETVYRALKTDTYSINTLAGWLIIVLGVVLSTIHVWHFFAHDKPLSAQVVGIGIPLLFTLAVVYAGYWVMTSSWPAQWARYLAFWTLSGTLVMGLLAGVIVLHQYLAGTLIDDAPFLMATAASGGALGGFLIGVFQGRYRRKAERIETIHEATQALMAAETKAAVCTRAVEIAREGLQMPLTGVWLHDEDESVLRPVGTTETGRAFTGEYPTFEPDASIAWDVFRDGEVCYVSEMAVRSDAHNPETPVRSEVIAPLGDHGVFIVGSPHPGAFDDVDVTTVKVLASTITAALDRAEREEELREQRTELQQQTAQLDSFAQTVSHDLRNPLNVALLSLDMARDSGNSEQFDRVDAALERMQNIIEDVLWLAREGHQIGEKKPVDLETTARAAWGFVDTQQATLRCDCDWLVCGDADRLQQLFENLFRNAVEHGGTDVTVTVGTLDGGFYIEDTGPGISEADCDEIFSVGYSTAEDGTGFGLAIVEQIVGAHGWEIAVTEGADGGARFDVSGVEAVDDQCCVT